MISLLIPSFLLYLFGTFNIVGIRPSLLINQIVFLILGAIIFFVIKKLTPEFFRLNSLTFYVIFVGLLIATYILGMEVKGSRRWIDLHFFTFQSSEFLKIFFILFFADFYSKNKRYLKQGKMYLLSLFFFILPAFIIFKQPDLGSSMVYAFVFLVMLFFSGIPKKTILISFMVVAVILPLGWPMLKSYQKDRILSFVNPHIDQGGTSYNMTQAIITIGSGNFIGKGLGLGTQSQLYFLPENHTDFAFSALVEQFGFIGGLAVIGLYFSIFIILVRKIIYYYYQKTENSQFKFFFYLGFLAYFVCQIFVNMGMNMGIMPITGIPLPLISYGGSAMLTWVIGLALLP